MDGKVDEVRSAGPAEPARRASDPIRRTMKRRIAAIQRRTWVAIAGVFIAAALYYPFDAVSEATRRGLPAYALLLLGLGWALLAYFVGKWLERLAAGWLYRPVRERIAQVGQLVGEVRELSQPSKLFDHVPRGIDHIFELCGTAIYVLNGSRFELVGVTEGVARALDANDPLLLQVKRDLGWRRGDAASARSSIRSTLIWPIEHGDRLVGLLLAGRATDDLPRFAEDEEAHAVRPVCDLLALAMQHANPLNAIKGAVFLDRAEHLASAVSRWFEAQFALLTCSAAGDALSSTDIERFTPVLRELLQQLDPAFSGVYVLDQNGIMLDHEAPPEVQIRGKSFDHRPYFRDCVEQMAPVVCDMLDTADRRVRNRAVEILVLAVPRKDAHGNFIGILDAVVDLPRDPFSRLAVQARDAWPLPEGPRVTGIRVVLIDSAAIVLGKSDSHERVPRASVGGQPVAERLRRELRVQQRSYAREDGAIVRVAATPFFALAYESDDLADQPQ